MALIEIRDLTKAYQKEGRNIEVLRGVTCTIEKGETVAIVGASGAGKSTLLHVLGTLDVPTSGRILFDNLDVFALRSSALAKFRNESIGFVFQFHHLLPEFSAVENVAMPALINRLPKAEAQRKATELLERVGLSHRLTHKPGELSGGEQQRVALARALVMSPKLLLADEPTGNLDVKTGDGIHSLFTELNDSLGITIVTVTHNPDLAKRSPRALQMHEGQLHEIDDIDEFFSNDANAPA